MLSLIKNRPSSISVFKTKGHVNIVPGLSGQPLWEGILNNVPFQEEGRAVQVIPDSVMILALITDLVHPSTGMHEINTVTGQVHWYISRKNQT